MDTGRIIELMEQERPDTPDHKVIREISRVTLVGVAVNVMLAVLKFTGGYFSGSRALLADAVHTLSDLATDAAVLIGVRYWTAPPDEQHPYGHRKVETLVTLLIGLALAAVGLGMGYEAILNLSREISGERADAVHKAVDTATWLALSAAVASLVSKELLYRWTAAKGIAIGSTAVVANAWHHRSDAFSSIPPAIAIGANIVASGMGRDLWFLDPVGTIVVCVMLLQAAWSVTKPTFSALLDASADRKLNSAIAAVVLSTPGVAATHKIRSRCIGSGAIAVDLHVLVKPTLTVAEGHDIASKVKYRIMDLKIAAAESRIVDVIVHLEPAE